MKKHQVWLTDKSGKSQVLETDDPDEFLNLLTLNDRMREKNR